MEGRPTAVASPWIELNGSRRAWIEGQTVAGLLDELGIDPRIVAVECNGALVRRPDFAGRALGPGDRVEIVRFVQGG